MSENEVIELFSQFGYEILKHGTHYSVFDRRLARRTVEADSLDILIDYAERIYMFPFMSETLEKTIASFKKIFGLLPDEPLSDTFKKIYGITPDRVSGEEQEQDPDQESSPVSPVTDQDTEDQEEPEPEKDSPVLYTKTCKGCGKQFQTAHKQSMYCSPDCYPSSKKEKKSQEVEQESGFSVLPRPF